jgi:DNA-binding CsgD family transcriptional regulator
MKQTVIQMAVTRGNEREELFSDADWQRLARWFHLTPSQVRIASLLCAGYSQAAMAERAQLSINTVRMHLRGLFTRLNAHDRVGVLVRLLSAWRSMAEIGGSTAAYGG